MATIGSYIEIVRSLYHIDIIRQNFRSLHHSCTNGSIGPCSTCEIKDLFAKLSLCMRSSAINPVQLSNMISKTHLISKVSCSNNSYSSLYTSLLSLLPRDLNLRASYSLTKVCLTCHTYSHSETVEKYLHRIESVDGAYPSFEFGLKSSLDSNEFCDKPDCFGTLRIFRVLKKMPNLLSLEFENMLTGQLPQFLKPCLIFESPSSTDLSLTCLTLSPPATLFYHTRLKMWVHLDSLGIRPIESYAQVQKLNLRVLMAFYTKMETGPITKSTSISSMELKTSLPQNLESKMTQIRSENERISENKITPLPNSDQKINHPQNNNSEFKISPILSQIRREKVLENKNSKTELISPILLNSGQTQFIYENYNSSNNSVPNSPISTQPPVAKHVHFSPTISISPSPTPVSNFQNNSNNSSTHQYVQAEVHAQYNDELNNQSSLNLNNSHSSNLTQNHEQNSTIQQSHEQNNMIQQNFQQNSPIQKAHLQNSPMHQSHTQNSPNQQNHPKNSPIQQNNAQNSPFQQNRAENNIFQQNHAQNSPIPQNHAQNSTIQQNYTQNSISPQNYTQNSPVQQNNSIQQNYSQNNPIQQNHAQITSIQQNRAQNTSMHQNLIQNSSIQQSLNQNSPMHQNAQSSSLQHNQMQYNPIQNYNNENNLVNQNHTQNSSLQHNQGQSSLPLQNYAQNNSLHSNYSNSLVSQQNLQNYSSQQHPVQNGQMSQNITENSQVSNSSIYQNHIQYSQMPQNQSHYNNLPQNQEIYKNEPPKNSSQYSPQPHLPLKHQSYKNNPISPHLQYIQAEIHNAERNSPELSSNGNEYYSTQAQYSPLVTDKVIYENWPLDNDSGQGSEINSSISTETGGVPEVTETKYATIKRKKKKGIPCPLSVSVPDLRHVIDSKKVSFDCQVTLVDEGEEEYMPHPILQRVLAQMRL